MSADLANTPYPRDLLGYGANPPHANWPNNKRLALNFVINYEEGGERSMMDGDGMAESYLADLPGLPPIPGERSLFTESVFEYGSRTGIWRLLNLFKQHDIKVTIYGIAQALERNPDVVKAIVEADHEVANHAMRWIDYSIIDEAEEKRQLDESIRIIEKLTGQRPLGWYCGRFSQNTHRLVAEEGGFLYNSDDYSDDLPFWREIAGHQQLIVPYTIDANDMRFCTLNGFGDGEQFFQYLKDCFDVLYEEGSQTQRMMTVGLHGRLSGRPARFAGLKRFVEYVKSFDDVWLCKRVEIARHWHENHPPASKL